MTWCKNFKKAIEEETIKLIDRYESPNYPNDDEIIKTEKGYYILDQFAIEEMCHKDHPSEPRVPIKFCPYCGGTITMEDI